MKDSQTGKGIQTCSRCIYDTSAPPIYFDDLEIGYLYYMVEHCIGENITLKEKGKGALINYQVPVALNNLLWNKIFIH